MSFLAEELFPWPLEHRLVSLVDRREKLQSLPRRLESDRLLVRTRPTFDWQIGLPTFSLALVVTPCA